MMSFTFDNDEQQLKQKEESRHTKKTRAIVSPQSVKRKKKQNMRSLDAPSRRKVFSVSPRITASPEQQLVFNQLAEEFLDVKDQEKTRSHSRKSKKKKKSKRTQSGLNW